MSTGWKTQRSTRLSSTRDEPFKLLRGLPNAFLRTHLLLLASWLSPIVRTFDGAKVDHPSACSSTSELQFTATASSAETHANKPYSYPQGISR